MLTQNTANNTLTLEYCERIDNNVVNAPAPTKSGNTTGTNVASQEMSAPSRNKLTSKIISILNKNKMSEPAIAKDDMSSPNKRKNASPAKKNDTIKTSA